VSQKPETSIVIRAFNEEKYLKTLLEAIQLQDYKDFEIILVDSGSYDQTLAIAHRYGDKVVQIESRDFTFGYSLNVGIKNSRGRFLVLVSAHTEPVSTDWLRHLVEPLRDAGTAMVYGRQFGADSSKFSELQDFRRTFGSDRKTLTPPHFFANNANSALKRQLWESHPFDEELTGLEDIQWSKHWMEQGLRVVYEPKAAIYHIHEETWPQIRHRYYREAAAAQQIGIKSRADIVRVIFGEGGYFLEDVFHALLRGGSWKQFSEIALFRFHKTMGTIKGLVDGTPLQDPATREKIYYDKTAPAVVIQGPGRAQLLDVEVPTIKPGDVLIRVAYEGICATDVELLEGRLGYYKEGLANYPIIPGHEFSGRVAKVGANVDHLQQDDPVVVECIQSCGTCEACRTSNWIDCSERKEVGVIGKNGGYAHYVVVPGKFVHQLPSDLDLKKGTLCEPLAVVLKGLRRLEQHWGHSADVFDCAVVGGGPIGHLCALVLSHRGHKVTVVDRNLFRLSYFQGTRIQTENLELENPLSFQVIIEATGDSDALHSILNYSRAGSVLLLLGLPYARREFNFESIVAYDKTVIGSVGSSAEDFEEAIRILPDLKVDRFLEKTLPLCDFDKGWELSREGKHLKVLLDLS
jgi:threonine dehydrogenase-like Zn-dependent dehydrogenase/glycosyltransferase involved in cell wall biosynthesis